MSGYLYDVFLSWRREEPVAGWFRAYFQPQFEARLRSTLGHEPRVFWDERDIATGEAWPEKIRTALRRSKLLVAVWEPQYFRSEWCMCELKSMMAREQQIGLRCEERPGGLVLPVVVRDGKHFKEWLDQIQTARLDDTLTDAPAYRECRSYVEHFLPGIDRLCGQVEDALDHVPAWSDTFPIVDAPTLARPTSMGLPRFGRLDPKEPS